MALIKLTDRDESEIYVRLVRQEISLMRRKKDDDGEFTRIELGPTRYIDALETPEEILALLESPKIELGDPLA